MPKGCQKYFLSESTVQPSFDASLLSSGTYMLGVSVTASFVVDSHIVSVMSLQCCKSCTLNTKRIVIAVAESGLMEATCYCHLGQILSCTRVL